MSRKALAAFWSRSLARPSRSRFCERRRPRMVAGPSARRPTAPGCPVALAARLLASGPGCSWLLRSWNFADANADGSLSPEEAAKAAEKFVRRGGCRKEGFDRCRGIGPGDEPADGTARWWSWWSSGRSRWSAWWRPPGGGPGGFGPGTFLGPRILEAADANKDGRLSPEEAGKAAERFVREADTKKKGSLDEDTLAGAINQRMGPPPGFGPGGPGGPMGQERKLVKQFDKNADGRLIRWNARPLATR